MLRRVLWWELKELLLQFSLLSRTSSHALSGQLARVYLRKRQCMGCLWASQHFTGMGKRLKYCPWGFMVRTGSLAERSQLFQWDIHVHILRWDTNLWKTRCQTKERLILTSRTGIYTEIYSVQSKIIESRNI